MRCTGIQPVLYPLVAESYPTEIRTFSVGINGSLVLICGFISVKLFPELKNLIGIPSLCFIHATFGLMAIFWGLWKLPDNRGKSLVKVEESFEKKATEEPEPSAQPSVNRGFDSKNFS